jgi:pyruvate,water dikinase
MTNFYIRWFIEIGISDVHLVGGKNASLGEMYRALRSEGVRVPNGFATTADAYRDFLRESGLFEFIRERLATLDVHNVDLLKRTGADIRARIKAEDLPKSLADEIRIAYRALCREEAEGREEAESVPANSKDELLISVAVRSSATAEDLPNASFAGQQESYLNICGEEDLLIACRNCFASLFTDRAISYRVDQGFDHDLVALSVGVQKMVRSDLACSGVMFSIDTESGFKDVVLVTGSYGLGETIVQGTVNPDEYYVFKPTLKAGYRPILSKSLGSKKVRLVYDDTGRHSTKLVRVPKHEREHFVLTEDEIIKLAEWAVKIEAYYSNHSKRFMPMDIEWAKDGLSGELFIVQARPETVVANRDNSFIRQHVLQERSDVLVTGRAVGQLIGSGKAHVIVSARDIEQFRAGEVLITETTDPDWEPIMKFAAAIVTEKGGRTSHAAIVSRELGIPCIVGASGVLDAITTGMEVTVSCAEGDEGRVYRGKLKFTERNIDLSQFRTAPCKIMLNVGDPENAFNFSFLPNDGVGLARLEFIISSYIRLHPLALINPEKITDIRIRREINKLTTAYASAKQYFIDRLAEGVARIAAAFYPKPVIVRMSDFKSNEYANLLGGSYFEPVEENPMIGWRGASRYYDPKYRDGFALECSAVKKVREEMGLINVAVMIPFCRTVHEAELVIAEMSRNGLRKGDNSLLVYGMCEIPSNVILADQFLDIFDGFSIGSNDLTQLTLGLDRDSSLVANIFDERNEAVLKLITDVIKVARSKNKYIGICGDAPSTYPDFARFLVQAGIESLSLSPDALLAVRQELLED